MPIKGLTDRVKAQFVLLGKLRKGGPKPEKGYGFGPELSYFRFTSDNKEHAAEIVDAFHKLYGEKPVSLRVFLPFADLESNFSCWKEKWNRGGLVHRCDGENMIKWLDPVTHQYSFIPKPCPYAGRVQTDEEKKKDPPCDEVGRLTVMLPELWQAVGVVGYVLLETHSKNDMRSIQASLLSVLDVRNGDPLGLRGVEFVLRRSLETIKTPLLSAGGLRQTIERYLVRLEPSPQWMSLQLQAARGYAKHMEEVEDAGEQDAEDAFMDDAPPPLADVSDGHLVMATGNSVMPTTPMPPQVEPSADGTPTGEGHWTARPAMRAALDMRRIANKLTWQEVHLAFGHVAKLSDYPGTFEDALKALDDFAAAKEKGGETKTVVVTTATASVTAPTLI